MKWIFLVLLFSSVAPLSAWIRRHPQNCEIVWIAFGFLAVLHGPMHLYVAPISWNVWPGFVKGAEISSVDGLALSIFLAQRERRSFPLRFTFALYMAAVLLAAVETSPVQPSLFYAWQTARIFFVAIVVSRAIARDPQTIAPLLQGMGYALLVVLVIALWDRLGGGMLQATGGFAHQNQLGMMTHFVAFPFLAMLLAGGSGWLTAAVPIAGALIAMLTASRGTIAVLFAGYSFVFLFSLMKRITRRKLSVLVAAFCAAAVVVPLAMASLDKRMGGQSVFTPDGEREAFERAAAAMLADHPWGVGPNRFVITANTEGYYERAQVAARAPSRSGHVHNLYWLIAVETGYFGLIAYSILLLRPMLMGFSAALKDSRSWRGELALGVGTALLAAYLQSFLEWIFVSFQVQYMFGLTTGLAVGLAQSIRTAPSHATRRVQPLADLRPAPSAADSGR